MPGGVARSLPDPTEETGGFCSWQLSLPPTPGPPPRCAGHGHDSYHLLLALLLLGTFLPAGAGGIHSGEDRAGPQLPLHPPRLGVRFVFDKCGSPGS